ncbi:hypothetical protein MTR67_052789 [Solanum verrucosum]|uniref:Uncharacterized protein n=1 Tax=Solanum verrucosum TaxID=315347 RepID=A0AAF1A3T3_SOLVR|nr:hypothetical protein MTR67_052789 [Solanum verrucosum]
MQGGSPLTLECSTRSTACWMLILVTCVCIIIRCRPTGISLVTQCKKLSLLKIKQ